MRRLLFFCFTALLCATSARAYDFENSDTGTTFYYNILSNSTVEVVGLTEDEFNTVSNSYTDTYIDIPETVTEGNTTYTVVGIGDFAFYNCRSILSLTMPNTVTYIGQQAFFADMYLETITFSTALTTIGVNAFIRATALTSITLPENVTTLEGGAFSMCTGLKEITSLNPTPPSCVETSSSVQATFNNVTLSNLTLYVPAASKDAYSTAPVWQDFGEILAIGEEKVKTPLETGEHFVVDDIRYCVVSGEDQTVEVTYYGTIAATVEVYKGDIVIPATVDYDEFTYTVIGIGKQTFEQCEMTSLQLPEGLLYIDDYAFYQCVIPTFEIPSTVTTIGDYVFRSCGITSITIPKTVTSIGEELFYMSSYYLQEVTLDANVNTLPANTFYYCTALTTVSLPSTLYLLKSRAFINCSSLRSITVHNPKAPICDTEVFYSVPVSSCTLYVPKGSREAYATADTWKDFSNIVELDEEAETPPTDESRFVEDGIYYQIIDEEARTCEVTFATTSLNSYSGSIDIPETVAHNGNTYTVTGIGYSAFRASTSLTTVSLPASITAIGTYAFYKCSSLKEIVIPSTITAINEYSFYNCSSLTELTIPENISFIGNYAFYGCTNIKTITIEDCDSPLEFENNYPFYGSALTTLYLGRNITCDTSDHYSPFYNFSTLKNITFSENVTTLVDYQFEHNSGLEEITLPHWITDIGANVFRYCTNLKKVVVAEGRTALGYYIFADCTALTEVSLPEGLIYPRTGAFSGCTALEEIVLPTTLTITTSSSNEGYRMFSECTALRTVVMEGLPAIAQQMFYGCTSLTEIDMPSSITAVGQYSFQDCTNLERVTFKENIQTITIGSWAFYGCTKLSSVLLPQSLHVLNSETFRDCTSLRKVVFPNQTQTSSADNIFKNCTSLEEVILPVSLSIVAGQFDNCTSLSKLYVLSTTPPTVADATNYYADPFNNVPTETCVVYVPEGAKKNYVNDSKWSVFANIEELTDPLAVTYCVGEVATTSAQLNGFIAVGWLDVTEVGFEYWSADDDEATTVMVSDGNITTGTISYNLSDLVYGMRYTYRAYAKTATATFYGDEVSFALAIEGAHVFTLEVSDLTETTAVLNGRLVLPYGESITEMGFIYWATATPNVMHVIIVDNDALTYTLDGLTPETNYIYRAYAILADGSTIYGDDVAFTTLEDTTTGIDSISAYDLDSDNVEGYYTPDGRKINTPQKGVTIVRFTDGTVKKLFIK